MGKIKSNQLGFSTVEAIVIVVIIAAISSVGWLVVEAKHNADMKLSSNSSSQTNPVSTKKYVDTAKLYSIQYPANWNTVYSQAGGEGALPDWTKTSQGVTFVPPKAPENNGLSIQADATNYLTQLVQQNWASTSRQAKKITINGYDAQYVQNVFKGDAESYTDDNYLLTNKGATIFVTFREKYYHASPAAKWDVSNELTQVNQAIQSIKFLN